MKKVIFTIKKAKIGDLYIYMYTSNMWLITELLTCPSSDKVIPLVEDEIVRADSLHLSLRLVAIQSIAAEGLKSSVLQNYRKMIFQVSDGYLI